MEQPARQKPKTLAAQDPAWARPRASASSIPAKSQAMKAGMLGLVLGAVFGAIYCLPAQLLSWAVGSLSSGAISLAEAQGSAWSGSAIVELSGAGGRSVALDGRASWEAAVGLSGLVASLKVPACGAASVSIKASWAGAIKVGPLDCRLPSEALGLWAGRWAAMSPKGAIRLGTAGVELGASGATARGDGFAEVSSLCVAASKACPLGSYKLAWSSSGQRARYEVSPMGEAALAIQGSGEFGWGSSPASRFSGKALAGEAARGEVENLLGLMGARQGSEAKIEWGPR